MKNRKNRLIFSSSVLPRSVAAALCTLFLVSSASAQIPPDFVHKIDTVRILATPVDGGAQITASSSGELKINLGAGRYSVVVYTAGAETFERYIRFSTAVAQEVDTRQQANVSLALITNQCLVLVPRTATGVNSAPIIKDGAGLQRAMFTDTNYFFCYVRWTKENQKFSFNPTNGYNQDIAFIPYPGKVILWRPLDKTLLIETNDPFK